MANLTKKMAILLDKLYNLRGDDSVVLLNMEESYKSATETKERTTSQKQELEDKIKELAGEEETLASKGERLKVLLKSFEEDDFSSVYERLNLSFNPDSLVKEIETSLPDAVEKVTLEKNGATEELNKTVEEMNEAKTILEELTIRKEEALRDKERLNRYFDLALESNINITRDEITSLLEKLGFDENEQREGAKILMFPEDGLFDYEKLHKENPDTKDIATLVSGEETVIVDNNVSEEVVESNNSEANPEFTLEITTPEENVPNDVTNELVVTPEELSVPITNGENSNTTTLETPATKEDAPKTKEDLMKLLENLGFDYLDFTEDNFNKLLNHMEPELFKTNAELVENLGIKKDIFGENAELLYDKELNEKIIKLTGVGKLPTDIYLNPKVLIKYNVTELDNAIKLLQDSGLEPRKVPLIAY